MSSEAHFTRKQFVVGLLTAVASPGFALGLKNQTNAPQQPEEITVEHLKAYEAMIDVHFSDSERQAILADVRSFRQSYASLRSTNIQNSDAPSVHFRPIGRSAADASNTLKLDNYNSVSLPSAEEDIAFLPVAALASLVRRKRISPKELTQIYLARLQKFGGPLLNVITLTEELAAKQAERATEEIARGKYLGPLHGIPYGLKDLFAVRGYPTTWGAAPYKNQSFDYDCAVFERLTAAGAICCAKLSMGALAMNDVWFNGRTKNPWNPTQGSSGSSAGSCSAVAAGLLPFAIGTETQGSIMSPSHRCRVTGLRPTFGRVSRFGAMALSWSMDKVGPICRTAEDAALVFAAIHGLDQRDQSTEQHNFSWTPVSDAKKFLSSLRIGYVKQSESQPDPDYIELLKRMGANPKLVSFGQLPNGIHIDLSVESAAAFDEFARTEAIHELKDSLWPNIFRAHRYVGAVEYLQAMRLRTQVMKTFETELGDLDAVFATGTAGQLLLITNRTGHPQLLIPNGTTDRNGQSVEQSFSIIGRLYGESTILKLGWLMQQQLKHHLKRPDMSRL